ncbi:MAG: cytidine deaminase [Bacteroidota bacterium]
MKKLEINTKIEVYQNLDELPGEDRQLLLAATQALAHSYSPYSNFKVAAALRLNNGQIVTGSNQENASYPLCLCAERVALAAADATYNGIPIQAIAITARHPERIMEQPAAPCGACRQVMCESEQKLGQPMRVLLRGERGIIYALDSASDLLPLAFAPDQLLG